MLAAIRAKCGAPVGVITSTTGDGGGDSCGTYGERCAWHYCNFSSVSSRSICARKLGLEPLDEADSRETEKSLCHKDGKVTRVPTVRYRRHTSARRSFG
jgi:hypothetical protein